MTRKTKPTIADRVAALEQRLSAVERQVKPAPVIPKPWWVVAYPAAYRNRKESNNG